MDFMNDASMLELFRIEAESNTAVLEQGLVSLEADQRPERVEPLMRAAHSLKGAARIVGLPAVVELAHAMEDLLEACRTGGARLASGDIDLLLAATDQLREFAAVRAEAMQQAVGERAANMAELAARLRRGPGAAAPDAHPAQPAQPAPKTPPPALVPDAIMDDPTMLELFRMEAQTHAAGLETGLAALDQPGANASDEALAGLANTARALRGAARIIGFNSAAGLAQVMEELLEARRAAGDSPGLLPLPSLRESAALFTRAAIEASLPPLAADFLRLQATLRAPQPETSAAPALLPEDTPKATVEAAAPPVAQPPAKPEPCPPAEAAPPAAPAAQAVPGNEDGVVRVSAAVLSRLMGLAGETLIEARRLTSFATTLTEIQAAHEELADALAAALPPGREAKPAWVSRLAEARELLAGHSESVEQAGLTLETLCERLYAQVIQSRMRPFEEGTIGFPRMLRDLGKDLGKKIELDILGRSTRVDRDILQRLDAPLTHLLRNASDHGLEPPDERLAAGKPEAGRITLEARHAAGMLFVSVADDGRGVDLERLRGRVAERGLATAEMAAAMDERELTDFLFLPGFTTAARVTEVSGRGVGLDVVHSMVQAVGGAISVETAPGRGTTFTLKLPLTLSVLRTLLVEVGGEPYALPLARIDRVAALPREELKTVEDRQYAVVDGERVGLVDACQVLGVSPPEHAADDGLMRVVVVSDRLGRFGLVVERLLGERDLVVRPLDPLLGKVQDVSAAAFLEDGSPVIVLDADDLARSLDRLLSQGRLTRVHARTASLGRVRRVLVVDDSLTVREVERSLLSGRGYAVETAVDGVDGFNALRAGRFDMVVTDVDMPRMNGIELTKRIKADPELSALPVLIVSYKDREEDRMRGLEAGADYYLTKSSFHDESLAAAVRDLIGDPLGPPESPES